MCVGGFGVRVREMFIYRGILRTSATLGKRHGHEVIHCLSLHSSDILEG